VTWSPLIGDGTGTPPVPVVTVQEYTLTVKLTAADCYTFTGFTATAAELKAAVTYSGTTATNLGAVTAAPNAAGTELTITVKITPEDA